MLTRIRTVINVLLTNPFFLCDNQYKHLFFYKGDIMFGIPGNSDISVLPTEEPGKCSDRVILHCDLNNFFASVECLHHPEWRDLPVAVGGSEQKRHGIILAKNQLAKSFGVKTAEPIWQAKNKCPHLLIVPPHMDQYQKFSSMARGIYQDFTDSIEPFGIDECWLDVTGSTRLLGNGEKIANEIRNRMRSDLGITVSVGVSWNKIFAKLGSDMKKPDATTSITRENYKEVVWPLPVEDLLFVGKKTAGKLRRAGISTIGRLAQLDEDFMLCQFGKWGAVLLAYANGRDVGMVEKDWENVKAKGIGNSTTMPYDVCTYDEAKIVLMQLSESVAHRLRLGSYRGRTIVLYMRECDLEHRERQRKIPVATCVSDVILTTALELLHEHWRPGIHKPLRSLGIRVTHLEDESNPVQISLFDSEQKGSKSEKIEKTLDILRERFGDDSVFRALLLKDQ
jgi:DNA polymerase IV